MRRGWGVDLSRRAFLVGAAGAAGAAFLLLGAAGWRRHAVNAGSTDEVAQ